MNLIKKGSTDVTRYVVLVDSAAGTPETAYTITSLDLQYTRNRTAPVAKVDATALAATDSAHGDNKAIEINATSSPGLYRVDWPDAAFATGVDKVILVVSGTGLHPAIEEIQLVDFDPADGVRLGLTALPNAAADAAGGLVISDAGGLDADAQRSDVAAILVDTGTTLDDLIDTEVASIITLLGTPAGASVSADIAAVKSDSAAILVDTGTTLDGRIPAALTAGGNMKSDALAVSGSTAAADALEAGALTTLIGTADAGGSTTTVIWSALTASAVDDQFIGRLIIFDRGTTTTGLRGQATPITDYVHATKTFTVTAMTAAPASGDVFIVV